MLLNRRRKDNDPFNTQAWKENAMSYVKAFAAGFISTLIFHQGLLGLLFLAGVAYPRAPFDLEPVGPLGVPSVISLAFWAGVWGVALWPLLRTRRGAAFWAGSVLLGAVGPSLVGWFVVMPLHGQPPAAGGNPNVIVGALLLNAAWGLGYGLLMRWWQPGYKPIAATGGRS
jgi:hypothetical protein